jgi:PAS domain S-box-containing protein
MMSDEQKSRSPRLTVLSGPRWIVEKKVVAGFALALAILIAIAVAEYHTIHKIIEFYRPASATDELLAELEATLSLLNEAEGGSRGYILTGIDDYLEPYHAAVANLPEHISRLRKLTADNPEREDELEILEPLIARRLDLLQMGIDLRQRQGFAAADRLVQEGHGRRAMNSVRTVIGHMEDQERRLLSLRITEAESDAQQAAFITSLGSALGIGLYLLASLIAHRDLTERNWAREELAEAKEALEIRVAERTAELADANQRLRQELVERERAQDMERQVQARFRFLFASNPIPMWVFELETLRFLEVNDAAVAHYGYSHEEFPRLRLSDLLTSGDGPQLTERIQKRLSSNPLYTGVRKHRLKDGRLIDVEITAHKFDWDGRAAVLAVAQDITVRKREEEAIRHSEERYRALVAATSQMVWITNAEGAVVEDTPSWRAFTGQTEQEVKGVGWARALHPDDTLPTVAAWSHALATRSVYETEYRLRRHDGEYRTVVVRGVPLIETDGSIREWIGAGTDITERKRAEQALRASEQRYRRFVERNAAGVLCNTLDGTILDCNDSLVRILGYGSQAEVKTHKTPEFSCNPHDREVMVGRLKEAKALTGLELCFKRKDGSAVWCLVNVALLEQEGPDGDIIE